MSFNHQTDEQEINEGSLTWSSVILAPFYNPILPSAKTFDVQDPLLIRQNSVQRAFVSLTFNKKKTSQLLWVSKVRF